MLGHAVGRRLELDRRPEAPRERVAEVRGQVFGEVDKNVRGGVETEVCVADAEEVGTLLGLQAAVDRLADLVVRGLLQPNLGAGVLVLEVPDNRLEGFDLRGTTPGDEIQRTLHGIAAPRVVAATGAEPQGRARTSRRRKELPPGQLVHRTSFPLFVALTTEMA